VKFRGNPQATLNFGEISVDNFAGGGGASTGIEIGLGRPVDIAINHDAEAIAMHEINHPHTKHFCESVWDVDPREVTQGRPVGLAWFSPDCKHFSKAKGGKPVSKKIRGLAWVAIRWAATVKPRVIMLENVEEFITWGPITSEGRPCPKNKGRTFKSFVNALRRHGYDVEWKELRAMEYGIPELPAAPTIRKRLFLIARCDGQPIVWPEQTHGHPDSEEVRSGQLLPYRTAGADVIDWSIPCPSIFERKKPLAENTLRRIARGIWRYVLTNQKPYVVTLAHGEGKPGSAKRWGKGIRDLAMPMPTMTASGGYGVVAPVLTEIANTNSPRCMPVGEPLRTICAEVKGGHHAIAAATLIKHYGGNYEGAGIDLNGPMHTATTVDHHAVLAAHLVRQFGKSDAADVADPLGTVTAGGGGKTQLITSNLVKLRGTCKDGQPTDEPLPTITASGNHVAEVRAFLVKYYSEGGQDQSLFDPMHTIPTKDRIGLVTVAGVNYQIVDIGMRMLEPHELYRAQGFPKDYIHNRTADGKPLSKAAQVRMCGNSVCPPLAAALVRANLGQQAVNDNKPQETRVTHARRAG
jgi:DNA (cytosine-5)-methyltransferase 1